MRHCDTFENLLSYKLLNCHRHKMKPLPSEASHHAFLSISMKLESQFFWREYNPEKSIDEKS